MDPDMMTEVSFGAMSSQGSALEGNSKSITSRLQTMDGELQPMLNTWSGTARDTYLREQQNWYDAADKMAEILRKLGTSVVNSGVNYQNADRRADALFNGIGRA